MEILCDYWGARGLILWTPVDQFLLLSQRLKRNKYLLVSSSNLTSLSLLTSFISHFDLSYLLLALWYPNRSAHFPDEGG